LKEKILIDFYICGIWLKLRVTKVTEKLPFYAVFFLFSACGMGNMAQSNSLTQALCSSFNLSATGVSLIAAILALLVIAGGLKRISRLQTILLPFATAFYFILCFLILFKFKQNIIPAIIIIFKEAFTPKALKGFGMYKAIRFGVARGVFSNEAGLGSSTTLHAQASSQKSELQGYAAIIEIFIDTVLMCSLTALVILVSTNIYNNKLFGAQLAVNAFSKAGATGSNGISKLTALFAFMSLCSYAFYAEKSIEYLLKGKKSKSFKYLYATLVLLGGISSSQSVWLLADICNGLMAIPNLFALNCLHREIEYPNRSTPPLHSSCLAPDQQ
jgi:AGCS family alanine or glycine:cation symporter